MEKYLVNSIEITVKLSKLKTFLTQIQFPIAIFDFETFRNLVAKKTDIDYTNDFEKIFSVSVLIFNKREDLKLENLTQKNLKLFSKIIIPPVEALTLQIPLMAYQQKFYKFLISKLLKYDVKSLLAMGSRTEKLLLKNYLAYHRDDKKFKDKINYFFHYHKIFDLYEIWNQDAVLNIPCYKQALNQDIGATKKTEALIKKNIAYQNLLNPPTTITNHDVGRIIDQYCLQKICILPKFLKQVANHNQNDVLIGAAMLSLLFNLFEGKFKNH